MRSQQNDFFLRIFDTVDPVLENTVAGDWMASSVSAAEECADIMSIFFTRHSSELHNFRYRDHSW